MFKQHISKLAGVILAAAMVVSAAGCGSSSSTQTTAAKAGSAAGTAAAGKTAAATAAGTSAAAKKSDAKAGGSATICYPDSLTTCFLPFSASTGDRFSVAPAIESLGRSDISGNVSGWLADSFTIDQDKLTVTIKLKKDIKFSDGTDFNADAVIWNFNKMKEGGKESEIGSPKSFEKKDDSTVVLTYDKWANNWENVLSEVYIYCPSAFDKNGEDWAAINAVGTGPYVMTEYVKGDHISYKKNDNYWIKGKPYLNDLKIVFMKDTTAQQAALMNGEINLISTNNATLISTLQTNGFENIAKQAPDLGSIKYIMFASGDASSPFHDLKVRQAVAQAIDWDGYVFSLTGKLGIKVTQFGVPGAWSYDDSVKLPEYNVEAAKKLLADAGYANGFNTTISTITSNNDIATLLQASLKQIGITAEIKVLEDSDFNSKKKEGTYDGGIITGQGASKLDFTNNYIRLYSTQGVNYLKMMDHPKDYEDALFAARSAKTLDEKKTKLKEASKKMVADYDLILPMGATFSTCFTDGKYTDSGIYQTTSVLWTPEDIKTK
jgi:peptide/nickel transport system substrate-binding protein